MNVTVDGRGVFTLSLENGGLVIALDGAVIRRTKGNPSKRGNPPFADLNEARAYFDGLAFAQPLVIDEA
jgi:hypothetical protein